MSEIENPEDVKKALQSFFSDNASHYETYLSSMGAKQDIQPIRETVDQALVKIGSGIKSFVIYGEPQSGKTAMMIGLTSRLLDAGHSLIIVLLNDSQKLLDQNLDRFIKARLMPTPAKATDVYEQGALKRRAILFCKKNTHDLRKLSELARNRGKVIIDDEADYASPNAKINRNERTRINDAITELIKGNSDTYYIGVTATPARLDLNNTFDTDNEEWVRFKPHRDYIGMRDVFLEENQVYRRFSVSGNEEKDLEKAVIAFIVNVVHLNGLNRMRGGYDPENYCFLIHTSGRRLDHQRDASIVRSVLNALVDEKHTQHERYIEKIIEHVDKHEEIKAVGSELIIQFVKKYIPSQSIIIMNSDFDTTGPSTVPPAMFTFYIGGNVVSRGVTFDNLLGMFFTRSPKNNIQQDTYIQRARMLGSRKGYIRFFQLWIPPELFADWQKCFIYHHISLQSIYSTGKAPIWISGQRLVPTSASSIDKRNVLIERGEIGSEKFNYAKIRDILEETLVETNMPELSRLEKLPGLIPEIKNWLEIILEFIRIMSGPANKTNVNIIKTRIVQDDHESLYRSKGMMGGREYRPIPKDHHVLIVSNQRGEARLYYRYSPNKLRFFTKSGRGNGS